MTPPRSHPPLQLMMHLLKASNLKLAINYAVRLFNHQFDDRANTLSTDSDPAKIGMTEASVRCFTLLCSHFPQSEPAALCCLIVLLKPASLCERVAAC